METDTFKEAKLPLRIAFAFSFRLHDDVECYQTGRFEGGDVFWANDKKGRCPSDAPRGRTWFNVTVAVRGDLRATILLNESPVVDVMPSSGVVGRVGVLAYNRWQNIVFFKNVRLTEVAEEEIVGAGTNELNSHVMQCCIIMHKIPRRSTPTDKKYPDGQRPLTKNTQTVNDH